MTIMQTPLKSGTQVKILREIVLLDSTVPVGTYVYVLEYLPNYDSYVVAVPPSNIRAIIEAKFVDNDPQTNLNI